MKIRVILGCTLLLLAAIPSFALPLCQECNEFNRCAALPGAIERCSSGPGYCTTSPQLCSPPRARTVLTDWKVTSIEVTRSSVESITLTAPAAETATEVSATEATEKK